MNIFVNNHTLELNGIMLITGKAKKFLHDGNCVKNWFGQNNGFKFEFYPESYLYTSDIIDYVKKIIEDYKNNRQKYIIATDNVVIIRTFEVLCDVNDIMEDLDCYYIQEEGYNYKVENLSYSEYGISSIYEKYNNIFDELDEILRKKYENSQNNT